MTDPSWLDGDGVDRVIRAVESVAAQFAAEGHSLYLVGGVVRDLALGAHGDQADIDLTTDALPELTRSVLRTIASDMWTQGERFGTIGAMVSGRALEITTHRGEAYTSDSRKPAVEFGTDLQTDLSRRDFTINAMAIEIKPNGSGHDRVLHDPFDGLGDLRRRELRTPLDPVVSFTDDPLRMMRAARFIPRFGLTAHAGLMEAVVDLADRLDIVSVERVHDEFERLLALDDPSLGFAFLEDSGLLDHVAPGLDADRAVAAGAAASAEISVTARRAAFCWFQPGDSARRWLDHLRYSVADRRHTLSVLDGVRRVIGAEEFDPPFVRRMVAKVSRAGVVDVIDAARAVTANDPEAASRVPTGDVDAMSEAVAELAVSEDLDDLGSPITGDEIMRHLDLDPGPMVGEALAAVVDRRLDFGPISTEEALAVAEDWARGRVPERDRD